MMKKRLLALLLSCFLLLSACADADIPVEPDGPSSALDGTASEPPAVAQLEKDLVILYTNDVHCSVDDAIGYAGLAAFKKELEADNHVVLADVGDSVQGAAIGTLSKGTYIIDIMNKVGYDVMTVGNHEFDYGMDQFFSLVEQADFPVVCANFMKLDTENGTAMLDAYAMMEFDGVKVAFVGVATPHTLTSSTPTYFQDDQGNFLYGFGKDETGETVYGLVQQAVDAARAEGAQYVIALTHLGIDAAYSPWTSSDLIANTSGIDVVLDGHSHSTLECARVKNKEGEWVLLSQTGTKLNAIGMLLIEQNGSISTGLVQEYSGKDAQTEAFIKGIQSQHEALLNQVVAHSDVELYTTEPGTDTRIIRNAETNLGDFCADAYRIMAGADISFVNGGGIRERIAAGDITYGDIINVHPFGNALCMVEATGQEILDALELSVQFTPAENGAFLHVSGLTFTFDPSVPSSVLVDDNGMFVSVEGARRVQNVLVGGEPIDPEKIYTVASHDYMLKNGGDGYTMFQDNPLLLDGILLDNQVLINYIVEVLGGVIGEQYANPYGEGRIVAIE